ncbi:MAG TPA: 5-oxoprolinase subunit PxpB [Candidatus Baltobacteraceae bacterium]|nr:5-oxoprolinase subunit PxpB [Candidatus Baltobacteraceae bacterium]
MPNITRFGETALLLETNTAPSSDVQRRLGRAAATLQSMHGTIDAVAGLGNLTLFFDPMQLDRTTARAHLSSAWGDAFADATREETAPIEIPVRYGGDDGPDLEAVARAAGIDAETCIARHVAGDYTVYAMGFAPGFAYIGGLDATLRVPRRAKPRARVPAGSVAIADALTGVYPAESPGGWNLIGRTDLALFDPQRNPASLLTLGASVRFVRA